MQMNFASYVPGAAITASDTTLLNCRAIYINCTVAGNVVINVQPSGTSANVTFALAVGSQILPIGLDQGRVMSTGLTATATFVSLQ